MAKASNLINAYLNEDIPQGGGFIVSGFFDSTSIYAIYEITAYRNVKDIFRTNDGVTFKTDGNRTHILVEPSTYTKKFEEPVNREKGRSIPYRFNEMEVLTAHNNEKIMIPTEPTMLHTSFTILEKNTDFFSFIFHPTNDVYVAIKRFIADSLYNDCSLSKVDALKAAETSLKTIKKFTIWNG